MQSPLFTAQAGAVDILPCWRGHWGLENRLHWVRDAVLREDHCGANVGLSLLRLAGAKGIISTLCCFASRPLEC